MSESKASKSQRLQTEVLVNFNFKTGDLPHLQLGTKSSLNSGHMKPYLEIAKRTMKTDAFWDTPNCLLLIKKLVTNEH